MALVSRYIALFVPGLHAAEDFYSRVFDMRALFREGKQADGSGRMLGPDRGWEDAEAAEVTIDMVALARDDFVLALFPGAPQPGTVLEFGLYMSRPEIAAVAAAVEGEAMVLDHEEGFLQFDDPFGFRWTVLEEGTAFVSLLPEFGAS